MDITNANAADPIVIRAGMADLVALAFYRVGYRPRESLVVVGMRGPRRRVGVVSRVDLPPVRYRRPVVERQLQLLHREGETELVALVVSDAAPHAGERGPVRLPHRPLTREVCRSAARLDLRVLDLLAVGPTSWRSYRCSDLDCCPPQGNSLEAALTGPAAAHLVAQGYVLAPDEPGLVADVEPAPPTAPDSPAAPAEARPASGPGPGPDFRLDPDAAAAGLARWRELLANPAAATAPDIAALGDVLCDRWVRDAILLTLSPTAGTVPEEILGGGDPAAMDAVFASAPDDDLLERGRVLLSAVARSAPGGRRANALALLAWAAWWNGDGARGRLLAARALADHPGHRLARLVDGLLMHAVAPPWVEDRRPPVRRAVRRGDALFGS